MGMDTDNRSAVLAAMMANAGIALAKFFGFFMTGAASMLAEAVHSVADSGNQALLLWGAAASKRDATRLHPFGYGRERFFWSFVVAVVLFLFGGAFAMYEGIHKLSAPEPVSSPGWAIGILCTGILLEGWSFRTAIIGARKQKGKASWWSYIRHARTPELPVVLLEDLGALIGLVLALVGVVLAAVTGDGRFDAIGSIAIGGLLAVIAVVLALEMKSLLIGESANASVVADLEGAITSSTDVSRLIHMRTLHLGPDELLVAAKVEFRTGLDVAQIAAAVDAVEAALRSACHLRQVIYIEPDLYRASRSEAGRVDATRPSVTLPSENG